MVFLGSQAELADEGEGKLASIFARGVCKVRRIVSRRLKPGHGALKAAIIGCGKISADDIGGYEGTTDAMTVAVSDISAGRSPAHWISLRSCGPSATIGRCCAR